MIGQCQKAASVMRLLRRHVPRVGQILACGADVYKELGHGLAENLYQKALERSFQMTNLRYSAEHVIPHAYRNQYIGSGRLDFLVDGAIIVETKALAAQESAKDAHLRQLQHYLVQHNMQTGVLLQFPKKPLPYLNASVLTQAQLLHTLAKRRQSVPTTRSGDTDSEDVGEIEKKEVVAAVCDDQARAELSSQESSRAAQTSQTSQTATTVSKSEPTSWPDSPDGLDLLRPADDAQEGLAEQGRQTQNTSALVQPILSPSDVKPEKRCASSLAVLKGKKAVGDGKKAQKKKRADALIDDAEAPWQEVADDMHPDSFYCLNLRIPVLMVPKHLVLGNDKGGRLVWNAGLCVPLGLPGLP